ncbi:hypothetical protein [Streptomyces sp. NPDC052107]|uniref:calcium-binding protein n=1 Tax=Streptomyces sp. NPDC052107 TaxID=3155632 RepID=UPI003448B2E5
MKILSSTVRRVAGPALAAGLAVTAFATPASAAPAPGSTVTRFGGSVVLSAAAGVKNQVTASVSGGLLIMEDLSGVTAGPGCTQLTATTARCGSAGSVGQLTISVGDQDDTVTNSTGIRSVIDAGPGNDIVNGGTGNDTINAGTGTDTVNGGGGNDTINVHDGTGGDTVTCGDGFDVVSADPGDIFPTGNGCEVGSGIF